jgi:hypothetical protein
MFVLRDGNVPVGACLRQKSHFDPQGLYPILMFTIYGVVVVQQQRRTELTSVEYSRGKTSASRTSST